MENSIDLNKYAVPAEKLRWVCRPDAFQFECTEDVQPLREFIGQDRAMEETEIHIDVSGLHKLRTGH